MAEIENYQFTQKFHSTYKSKVKCSINFHFNSIIQEVALQLHGVVVEIKIIKRKGERLYDVENVELPIAVAAVTESAANNQPLQLCERTGTVITSVKTSPAMQHKIQQIEERNKGNGKLPLSNRECNPNVIDHHIVMRTYCPSSSTVGTTTQRTQCKYPGKFDFIIAVL